MQSIRPCQQTEGKRLACTAISLFLFCFFCMSCFSLWLLEQPNCSVGYRNGKSTCSYPIPNFLRHGLIYQTNIIQEDSFIFWTNLSIFILEDDRFCNHLTRIEGTEQDAMRFINQFQLNDSSYVFDPSFIGEDDNACNPDSLGYKRGADIAGTILWFVVGGIAGAFGSLLLVLFFSPNIYFPTKAMIFSILCLSFLSCYCGATFLAILYPFCKSDGSCGRMPTTRLPMQQIEGVVMNVTCDYESNCLLWWSTQQTQGAFQDICWERKVILAPHDYLIGMRASLLVNPSSKVECRQTPQEWINNWNWIVNLLTIGTIGFIVTLLLACCDAFLPCHISMKWSDSLDKTTEPLLEVGQSLQTPHV